MEVSLLIDEIERGRLHELLKLSVICALPAKDLLVATNDADSWEAVLFVVPITVKDYFVAMLEA